MDSANIPVWELLQKQITWSQLSFIHNKRVLDFGSGRGQMIAMEQRVCEREEFRAVASFHHLILRKK